MRILKFALVGISGIFLNEILLWFFTEIFGIYYIFSGFLATEIAIISNFILNEFWTFKDRSKNHKGIFKRMVKCNILYAGGMVINIASLYFFTKLGIYYLISNLIGIGIAFIWNYSASLKWAWKMEKIEKIEPLKNPKVSVIIPTYNERENIKIIVPKIFDVFEKNGVKGEVIIVDDNSPDKTGDAAEELAKKFDVKVLHRKAKLGLSSAVVDGFKKASGDILGVMDADLSHPPEVIPNMLKYLIKDADFGSQNWGIRRKIISKGACLLAKGLTNVKDPMSGFFFFRKDVIKNANLNPKGFKICLEILVKGNYKKVLEVPYTFVNRKFGESKLNWKEEIKYLEHLLGLYFYKIKND
jgi:dolichol-phosphate mannosyltransferase